MHLPCGVVGAAMYPLACLSVAPVHSIYASKGKERDTLITPKRGNLSL